ncbi:MAG: hypothetical protein AAB250_13410, partial [Bdellovibrionota bacterium]
GLSDPLAIAILALVANVILISFAKLTSILTAGAIAVAGLILYKLFIQNRGRTSRPPSSWYPLP